MVVEVGEKRTAQCPIGDCPGVQSGPDSREARPRLRDHGRNSRAPQVVVHQGCPA